MVFWQDRRLIDVLQRQAGLSVKVSGAPGDQTSLFVRGTNSNHTAFFLDGRRMNPGMHNQYNIENLQVDSLGSVQLQKGASSVNYGSAGIGGVVDLQPKSVLGTEGYEAQATLECGSNAYGRAAFTVSVSDENWGVSFGGASLETDNERDSDGISSESYTVKGEVKATKNLTAELLGDFSYVENDYPGPVASPEYAGWNKVKSWLVSPGLRYITDEFTVHGFYTYGDYKYEGPYGVEAMVSDELSLQADYAFMNDVQVSIGAIYRDDEVDDDGLNLSMEQFGIWAQVVAQPMDSLELRAGARNDKFSDFDNSLDANVEVIYTAQELGLSVFTKLATSYAPPKPLIVGFESADDHGTPLEPEKSVSYEFGLRQKLLDDKLELDLVLFRNEIEDLVESRDIKQTWDYFNLGNATTEGIEFSADYELCKKVDLGVAYTYLTAVNEDTDARLAYRPRHTVQLSATYQTSDDFSFGLHATGCVDREPSVYDGIEDIEDFIVASLVANWKVYENLDLFIRVENLLDEEYAVSYDYPSLGRAGYFGARLSF
jgi:vitamin B12 transporter